MTWKDDDPWVDSSPWVDGAGHDVVLQLPAAEVRLFGGALGTAGLLPAATIQVEGRIVAPAQPPNLEPVPDAIVQTYANVGPSATVAPDAAFQHYVSVGLPLVPSAEAAFQHYVNVGLHLTGSTEAAFQHYVSVAGGVLMALVDGVWRPVGCGTGSTPGRLEFEIAPGEWVREACDGEVGGHPLLIEVPVGSGHWVTVACMVPVEPEDPDV